MTEKTYITKRVKFGGPVIGDEEIAEVMAVLKNQQLTNGACVRAFEEKFQSYIGGGNCTAVSSCTSGLYLALKALGIGHGDEVIVPAQTFIACAHAIEAAGATPIFVDSWGDAGVMDPELVEAAISPTVKAIMPVHYAGRPCFMGSIMDIARRRNVKVIEDCATALGAWHSNRHVGLLGDVGVFSFHPVKHITTGEGGMVVTRQHDLGEKIKCMREFGKVTDGPYVKAGNSGEYDVIMFGMNCRMTEMQGALGLRQLDRADKHLEIRKRNYRKLANLLSNFELLDLGVEHAAAYCLIVRVPDGLDQRGLRKELQNRHVETSVYYPGPLPLMTYYRQKFGYEEGDFPVAEGISKRTIALSVGPHLHESHIVTMGDAMKEACRRRNAA